MGVIEQGYLQEANDPRALAGPKTHVNYDEVDSAIGIV
jgi:hypothetical protein